MLSRSAILICAALGAPLIGCRQNAQLPATSPPSAAGSAAAGLAPVASAGNSSTSPASDPPAPAGGSPTPAPVAGMTDLPSAGVPAAAGGGGSSAVAGAASLADPNTVTIKMDEFEVPALGEVFMCQDFDNPFGGMDVAVGRSESTMTRGTHHLHVYYGTDAPAAAAAPCKNPNEFRPMIHLATVPDQVTAYPAGTAAKLKGSTGLRFQSHYVNLSDQPVRASVVVKLTKVDPASITRWVAQLHFNRTALAIKPGATQSVTTSCTIPDNFGPIGLLFAISHMHKQGVHFVATTSSGVPLLDTTEWDEAPPVDYAQPVMLNPGDAISWTCTYQNPTQQVITYGDSALKNEMCIYIARFFSSPNGDDLECETPSASATARVTKNVAGQ